jgi:hypothetical protein
MIPDYFQDDRNFFPLPNSFSVFIPGLQEQNIHQLNRLNDFLSVLKSSY